MLLIGLPDTTAAYVTLDEIRAMPNLDDTTKFTDDELSQARLWFETKFEEYVGMAFVPRTATQRLTGGRSTLMLKNWPVREITAVRSFTSATVSTTFTADELADLQRLDTGEIKRYSLGYWPADVEVEYTHGQTAPDEELRQGALIAIRQKVLDDHTGDHGDRQLGVAQEGVFIRTAQGPFFNSKVNDLANGYRAKYHLPAIA